MAAPIGTILLQKPELLLTGAQTGQNIAVITPGFQLGVIEQIWVGSYRKVGDIVSFPLEGVVIINDGVRDFFMVDENKITYQEAPSVSV